MIKYKRTDVVNDSFGISLSAYVVVVLTALLLQFVY